MPWFADNTFAPSVDSKSSTTSALVSASISSALTIPEKATTTFASVGSPDAVNNVTDINFPPVVSSIFVTL